ncbi:hypothetical protein MYX64_00725 [Nitrospinae bacterium AH_259_B05_G02_I21]|nr:hypothetical protein [Nitrospinae bacterium AH_259_B05_G02_I21]MDA2931663.1 hypothetical protein [Nitrospinae bacterium AH-259-F20]
MGQLIEYESIPLWEFLAPALFVDLENLVIVRSKIEALLEREKPDWCAIIDPEEFSSEWAPLFGLLEDPWLFARVFCAESEKRGIPVQRVKPNVWKSWRSRWLGRLVSLLHRLRVGMWAMWGAARLRSTLARLAALRVRRRWSKRRPIIFCSASSYWRKDYDPMARAFTWTDPVCYPVIAELLARGQGPVLAVDMPYSVRRGWRETIHRLWAERTVPWSVMDRFFTLRGIVCGLRWARARRSLWNSPSPPMSSAFRFDGLDLWPALAPRFQFLAEDYLTGIIGWIEAAHALVAAWRPRACAISYETGPLGRALIVACRAAGVPTLGLQHGEIGPVNSDYMKRYGPRDLDLLPDVIAVFDEATKTLLTTRSTYPAERVVVTGCPRFDVLRRTGELFRKEEILARRGLSPERPVVLFCPPRGFATVDRATIGPYLESLLQARDSLPSVQWVLKAPPGVPKAWYERALAARGMGDVVVTDEMLYEWMAVSDVVVTAPSTIGLEAILMGRPFINLYLDYYPKTQSYAAAGVALDVDTPMGLAGALERLLTDEALRSALGECQDQYRYKNAASHDGWAADRVAETLQSLLSAKLISMAKVMHEAD